MIFDYMCGETDSLTGSAEGKKNKRKSTTPKRTANDDRLHTGTYITLDCIDKLSSFFNVETFFLPNINRIPAINVIPWIKEENVLSTEMAEVYVKKDEVTADKGLFFVTIDECCSSLWWWLNRFPQFRQVLHLDHRRPHPNRITNISAIIVMCVFRRGAILSHIIGERRRNDDRSVFFWFEIFFFFLLSNPEIPTKKRRCTRAYSAKSNCKTFDHSAVTSTVT